MPPAGTAGMGSRPCDGGGIDHDTAPAYEGVCVESEDRRGGASADKDSEKEEGLCGFVDRDFAFGGEVVGGAVAAGGSPAGVGCGGDADEGGFEALSQKQYDCGFLYSSSFRGVDRSDRGGESKRVEPG